jgi:hypothetical protein
MVVGSPQVLRLLPPLKLVAEILLKEVLNTKNQSINQSIKMKTEGFLGMVHYWVICLVG